MVSVKQVGAVHSVPVRLHKHFEDVCRPLGRYVLYLRQTSHPLTHTRLAVDLCGSCTLLSLVAFF